MKKLLATALAVITILSVSITAFATEVTPRDIERTTIKVGYLDDYGIITTPIIRGAEGYGYEYLEKIEEYSNYHFEYVPLSWSEGLEQLKSGEIDLLAPASMSEERKEVYDFVDTIFLHEETSIYALEDSTYNYGEPEQLDGKTLGTLEGSVYENRFQVYADEHGLEYTIKYTDTSTVFEDLTSGKIDFYIDGSLYLRDGVHSVERLFAENLYLMTKKGNESLSSSINSAMLALEEDIPYYNELLWYKYYATAHEAVRKFTSDEITALQSKDVYTVGYHTDLHPVSYVLPDGEPKGYAIDVMNLLAEKLGISISYVPLHDGSGHSIRDVDFNLCPMNHGSEIHSTLSKPYDMQKLLAVRDAGLKKSDVQNILVPDYSTIEIKEYLGLYPFATVHKAYSSADCQRIYDNVDIDCTIIPDNSEVFIGDKTNKITEVLGVSVPLGITVSNKLPIEVRTALNKVILSLKESTVDDLVMDNVRALQTQPTFVDTLIQYRLQITLLFFFIAGAFIYILWESRKNTKRLLEVDTLTGTMTQYKFTKEAHRILASAKPNEYMMILLDIDKFKTINKVYGTALGNKLICILANSIKRQTPKDAIAGRVQSDAFVILTKSNEISQISLDEQFVKELKMVGIDLTVYFSIGVYLIENTTEDISYMLDNARTAKGYGKTIFGNTVHYFTKELQEKHEKESEILSSMETAIADQEFFIVVQPKVELQTKRLVGGEVLVRWKKKDGTFVYPDEFIPLFEENKFIIQLDRYVLEKTCELIHDSKLTLPVLSINVSATTMLEPDFIEISNEILQRYGVIPQQLEVELTESVLDADYKRISSIISELKKVGTSIAIDDFGKGASSLARIKEVEMDVLKLDKEFMENNTVSEKGKLVLNNIISMANDLGITSLAEGIETKEQLELLIQLGCEQGQGYYFDRPLSTLDFIQRVDANSKVAFEPVIRYQKDCRFWIESKDLPYGVAVAKNDQYSTIVQANDAFYDIIGYHKESFQMQHNNRLVAIMVDNLYNLVKKYLSDRQYEFSLDFRVITSSGEIIWVHYIVKYEPVDDLFFATMLKIADQNHLTDSTDIHNDLLQESNQVSEELEKALYKLREHYDADRAFFVQLSKADFLISDYQEVLQTGVIGKKEQLQFVQDEFMQILVDNLEKVDTIYIDVPSLKADNAYQALVQNFENNHINSVVYTAIKDADDHFRGFIGLDNPKREMSSFHFLENESFYIGAYLVQNKLKELVKQNRIQEESSKAGIVNLCINMLRTTTDAITTTNATTTTVLELLREHYEAKSCAIIHLLPKEQKYEIRHMNTELDACTNWDTIQKFSYSMVEKVVETFEKNKYALIKCGTEDFVDTKEEINKYEMLGIENGYIAPMFDINNKCNGMLVVTNPSLSTRSPMLVQIVGKFLSDYQVKYDIYLEQRSKISIEPMTGLLNKVATQEKIEERLQIGQKGVFYMVDVDNFKQINDKLGHVMGDKVIVDMAKALGEIFRKDDVIGRVGGDEFIIYVPGLITEQVVFKKAEQIVNAFAKTYGDDGVKVQVSASVGICISRENEETFQHLYQEADKALYRAKEQGKNQFYIDMKENSRFI